MWHRYVVFSLVFLVLAMPPKAASSKKVVPSLKRDKEISLKGRYSYCVGVDEAGRGPLAGPVVCASCYVANDIEEIDGVVDSKASTENDREITYEKLINNPKITYGVAVISHSEIDEINILEATLKGMRTATTSLLEKLDKKVKKEDIIALIDGNKVPVDMPIHAVEVIKGDSCVFSIAAASIIAKVTRDRIMLELDKKYPQYNFKTHKGYPTFEHRTVLSQVGPSPVHRYSYGPVRDAALHFNIPFNTYVEKKKLKELQELESNEKPPKAGKKMKQLKAKVAVKAVKKAVNGAKVAEKAKDAVKVTKKPASYRESPVGARRSTRLKHITKF